MSNRVSYALTVILLLIAAVLRMWDLSTLPPGMHNDEVNDVRIVETVRQGRVEVFYNLQGEGREGLYHAAVAAVTSLTGTGLLGYRTISVWIGLLTLALIYALGTRLFGTIAGLSATALLSINMWHAILSRSISPEVVLPMFVTAVLLALARSLPVRGTRPYQEPKVTAFAAVGILLGIGFYIHPLSLLVTLLSMTFILYMVASRRLLTRRTLSYTWFAVVVMIVIATPYLISTLQFPDLSGANRLLDINTNVIESVISALGGLFFIGDQHAFHNLPGRPLLDLVSGLLLVIGIIVALRCWNQSRCMLLLIALLFLAPFALTAVGSPEFTAFAGLLPLLALFFGLGVSTIYTELPRNARRVGAIGLIVLLAFNLQWTVRDLFFRWGSVPETQQAYDARLGQIAHYLDMTIATTPTVICTPNIRQPNAPVELTNTQKIGLMMHRPGTQLRFADCGAALILANGGEREQIIMPGDSMYERFNPYLRSWLDQGELLDTPNVPPQSVVILDIASQLADRIGRFTTTAPVSFAPETGGSRVTLPPVRLGGNITFLGYEALWASAYRPGDVVPVITYWRVDGIVPSDLRLFTHILADPGAVPAAQNDPISVLPEQLRPRDIFIQVSYVLLPFSIPGGTYSISVGAYEDNTDTRLTVFEGEQPRGTRLFLGQINVQR